MQGPAGTTVTVDSQQATMSDASSAFGKPIEIAPAKEELHPPFGDVLLDQIVNGDTDKCTSSDTKDPAGSIEDKSIGTSPELPGAERASSNLKFIALPNQQRVPSDTEEDIHAKGPAAIKSGTKVIRHRVATDPDVNNSNKKSDQSAVLQSLASPTFVALTATQATPTSANQQSLDAPFTLSPQLNSLVLLQASPGQEDVRVHAQSPDFKNTGGKTDDVLSSIIRSAKAGAEPQDLLAQTHRLQSTLSSQSSETRDLNVSTVLPAGENSSKAEQFSHSSLENGLDGTSLLLNKDAPEMDSHVAVTAQSKRKTTLEKISNDFGGNSIPPVRTTPSGESPLDMIRSKDGAPSVIVTPRQTEPVKEMSATVEANTFQRLDAGPVQATLLHSNAHQIAVGMHDPSLGWLEVQAQSSAGHISATVTANSMEAHASLTVQAPSITQYLADRDLPLHSLNVLTQSEMHSGNSGDGQSQRELRKSRQEMSESGVAAGVGKSTVLNDADHVSAKHVSHASYISVRV